MTKYNVIYLAAGHAKLNTFHNVTYNDYIVKRQGGFNVNVVFELFLESFYYSRFI